MFIDYCYCCYYITNITSIMFIIMLIIILTLQQPGAQRLGLGPRLNGYSLQGGAVGGGCSGLG